jgi:hypothetical protein
MLYRGDFEMLGRAGLREATPAGQKQQVARLGCSFQQWGDLRIHFIFALAGSLRGSRIRARAVIA